MRPKRSVLVGLATLAVVALGLVAFAFARPGAERPESYTPPTLFPSQSAAPSVRFAAVGDSISQGDSPDFGAGKTGSLSWVTYAKGQGLTFAGGWAVHGATTAAMADSAPKVDADVLVVVAGTNDVGQHVPFAQSTANLDRIAAGVGVKRVIVSAIPPRNDDPQGAAEYNKALQGLAKARGWVFVDAMAGVRDGDKYAAGMTVDGIHPTQQAAQIIGKALGVAITS